jgi:hypothetical protein
MRAPHLEAQAAAEGGQADVDELEAFVLSGHDHLAQKQACVIDPLALTAEIRD